MLISQAFRPMIELEKELAGLYESWSDRFASDREAAILFSKLSREERGHASLIDYQQRIFQKNRQFEIHVDVDVKAIEATIAEIRRRRVSAQPKSVEEALAIAIGMELSAAESHYRNLLRHANEEVERLLDRLSREDGAHLAALQDFAASRGIALPE